MFEFTDKAKKKIKVINVTEARGHFAAILSDNESHYIITKNNKPQRVIIGFEEFKQWQGDSIEGLSERPEQGEPLEASSEPAVSKPKPSPSVKGMIAAQIELSQSQEKPVPAVPADFSLDAVEEAPRREDVVVAEERIPMVTEDIEDITEEAFVEASATAEDETQESGDEATLNGDYFDSGMGEDVLEAPPETEILAAESVEESVIAANRDAMSPERDPKRAEPAAVTAEAFPARTPEEEAYFRRYRKLYEGFPPSFTEVERSIPTISLPESGAGVSRIGARRETILPATETCGAEPPALGVSANFVAAMAEGGDGPISDTQPEHEIEHPAGTEESLPSLQELLRDLDKERLTGEDPPPLDARDIDDIINRITSD